MTISQAIMNCMGKYATFSGRAPRSEFWWFYLFTVLISWGAQVAAYAAFPTDPVFAEVPSTLVGLVFLLPMLAAASRRLHDIGRSGWWQLLILTGVGIVLLVFWWVQTSQTNENKYGSPVE